LRAYLVHECPERFAGGGGVAGGKRIERGPQLAIQAVGETRRQPEPGDLVLQRLDITRSVSSLPRLVPDLGNGEPDRIADDGDHHPSNRVVHLDGEQSHGVKGGHDPE